MSNITKTSGVSDLSNMKLDALVEAAAIAGASIAANIIQLGGILNEISERYGSEGVDITCQTIGLSKKLFAKFIATYRGVLHPQIALGNVPYALKLEELPRDQQDDLIDNGVPYVEKVGKTHRTKRIKLSKLDTLQAKQVFDGNRLRTEDEQFQYIKDNENPQPKVARQPRPAWEIKKGKLIVHRAVSFPKDDLIKMLADM